MANKRFGDTSGEVSAINNLASDSLPQAGDFCGPVPPWTGKVSHIIEDEPKREPAKSARMLRQFREGGKMD